MEVEEHPDVRVRVRTVEFLRAHGLDELKRQFKIATHFHSKYPNLVQLKYDQLRSPFQYNPNS